MPEPRRYERALRLGLVVLLVALGVLSFHRATREKFDFHHFYLDARYVWDHGGLNPNVVPFPRSDEDRQLPFYLPTVPTALAPITALGRVPAALLWSVAQVAALGYSLRVLRRWGVAEHANPTEAALRTTLVFAVATAVALPAFIEAARFNQLSFFVLAMLLGGLSALDRNQPWVAGGILAAAAVLKLLPLVFLPWLLLKRRWSAAAAFVLAGAALLVLPPVLAFGPQRTVEYQRQWWELNARGDSARGLLNMDLPEHFINHRNQSIVQVLARWTWAAHRYPTPWQPVQLAPETSRGIAAGITAALGIALLVSTRRAWPQLSVRRRHAEAAVYMLGLMVFSPLLRQYYLVWAFPAVVLFAQLAAHVESARERWIGRAGLLIWLAGMLAWIRPEPRLMGAHLLMLIVLGVFLLWGTAAERRAVSIAPAPAPSA